MEDKKKKKRSVEFVTSHTKNIVLLLHKMYMYLKVVNVYPIAGHRGKSLIEHQHIHAITVVVDLFKGRETPVQ